MGAYNACSHRSPHEVKLPHCEYYDILHDIISNKLFGDTVVN